MTKEREGRALERILTAREVASASRHELRNKLGGIRNAAHYLRRRCAAIPEAADDPKIGRFFDLIEGELVSAAELLTAAGEPSEEPTMRREPLALHASVEGWRERLDAASVRLENEVPPAARVSADPRALETLVRALFENAMDALPEGGTVSVRAEGAGERRLTLVVEDSGPGFQRDDALRPLVTTKPGHAGLGLNVASRVARDLGGAVTVSAVGAPARIEVTLPTPEEPA